MTPLSDHYAILVAINRYPGIKNLYGPENDAAEFAKWLRDPAYGNLDPEKIKVIRSSDFTVVTDPDDANPTETQFKKVLNGWLRTKDDWQDRVGARLYLFFAGHGFTTGNLANPALFTAQAQWGDPAHIAGLQYAAKIQNAGFFDEIVLIMDCCQDVLKATQVIDPTWTPPDRQCTSRVKFLQAYGAPRGQKAFETPQDAPLPRGYFSSCLIQALCDAPSDADGFVTARAVEQTLAEIWNDRYWKTTNYNPPFIAPLNMRLYRRVGPPLSSVSDSPWAGGGPGPESAPTPPIFDQPIDTNPGSGGVPGDAPKPLVKVALVATDPGAHIQVFSKEIIDRSTGTGLLNLQLPPGLYTVRHRVGDAASDVQFSVSGEEERVDLNLNELAFSSPIPLEGTSTHHEYHHDPAIQLENSAATRAARSGYPDSVGTLLVFARDSAHVYGTVWPMAQEAQSGLRIRRLDKETGDPVDVLCEISVDETGGFSTVLVNDLPEGTYLVGARRREKKNWYWIEIPVTVTSSWLRTEVYLDCVDDDDTGRRFDIDAAAILVVSGTAGSMLDRPATRTTEIARLGLFEGRISTTPDALQSPEIDSEPMLALYSAYALTFASKPDVDGILTLCEVLNQHWSQNSADVKILERWAMAKNGELEAAKDLVLGPDEVPMFARGWQLLRDLSSNTRLSLNAQYSVGMWRVSSPSWTEIMIPDHAVVPEWESVRNEFGTAATHTIRIQEGDQHLDRIADVLSKPNPTQSPVQQVVRRAILDARESGDEPLLEEVLSNTANSLGLDESIIRWALNRLLMRAAIGMLGEYGTLISESITDRIGLETTDARRELTASVDDAEQEPPLTMTAGS